MTQTLTSLLARPPYRSELLDRLHADWGRLFREIAAGTVQRELDGALPFEAVRRLKNFGFGALRVPRAYGGLGATWPELTALWIELAAADSNLPQAFRGHFAFAEDRLWQHRRGHDQAVWFERFVDGEIAGNAWTEVGDTAIDTFQTVLDPQVDGYRLTGTKYYTTGSIFAEWADVHARRHRHGQDDDFAIAIVDTRGGGVTVSDDWDGFGQRGTGSGTTTFDHVPVPADHVLPFDQRFPYQTAVYQLNLLATLSGIARAALADAVDEVRRRERSFSHANASRVRDDVQVLARVGEIAAATYAAEAATLRVAAAVQDVSITAQKGRDAIAEANEAVEIESAAAQVVVSDLRPEGDLRPLRHPGRLRHLARPGPRPALAQRPHGRLPQPAPLQGPGGRRPSRQRHAPAVRLVDRYDAARCPRLTGAGQQWQELPFTCSGDPCGPHRPAA